MKPFSSRYNAGAFNFAMLVLRVGLGVLIVHHGYQKIDHFSTMENTFMNFIGLGSKISLCLVIFAEFICGILLVLGLFTRFACIPLIIMMCVALFKVHNGHGFGVGEMDVLYLSGFLAILFAGPGRISCDSMIGK